MTEAAPRGWLSKTLGQLFMKSAVIAQCEPVGERFRLITLESPQFCGVEWQAGQKLQVRMGSGFTTRTYTPLEWDATAGRTRILGYAHDTSGASAGPGSRWVLGVQAGEPCEVFGPRASLDASRATGAIAVFGDETSIGLIHAMSHQQARRPVRGFLEVSSAVDTHRALASLGLDDVECFEKEAGDRQLAVIEQRLSALVMSDTTFLFSGKSLSIQRLQRALKRAGLAPARMATKAYWAPGKTGLD